MKDKAGNTRPPAVYMQGRPPVAARVRDIPDTHRPVSVQTAQSPPKRPLFFNCSLTVL